MNRKAKKKPARTLTRSIQRRKIYSEAGQDFGRGVRTASRQRAETSLAAVGGTYAPGGLTSAKRLSSAATAAAPLFFEDFVQPHPRRAASFSRWKVLRLQRLRKCRRSMAFGSPKTKGER